VITPVVDTDWLSRHRDEVLVADVRWYLDGRDARSVYEQGHLPGAVFVDVDRDLAGPPSPDSGRHPLPDPDDFAHSMSRLGIGNGTTVVAYDDAGGVIAARLVWMLRSLDHPAAVLDGGIGAYGGALDTGPGNATTPAEFSSRPWPRELLATIDDATDPNYVVIDARDASRYRGEEEPVDPRAGHIPGARNLPCRSNLGPDGRLLPAEEIKRRFQDAGVAPGVGVISYCGSGITACHNLLALEHAGLGRGRLYPGSWSQYSNDPDRPAEKGD
jgi:thiosulfate/3-mercaptopyruvate sulfurtransferase